MGKMKDLHIEMLNEDWECMAEQERAFIISEREYMERQMMQQIWEEEQSQAKIIQDDNNQEVQENPGRWVGPEHADPATILEHGSGHKATNGAQQGTQLAFDFGEDKEDNKSQRLSL